MKADLKFNKRTAQVIECNFADFTYSPYFEGQNVLRMTVYASHEVGQWHLDMNPLEALRLQGQINEALAAWAKAKIKKDPQ